MNSDNYLVPLENAPILSRTSEIPNLTNINDDCKSRIFEYLKLSDLISIAETSKVLHTSVHDVFKRRYGHGKLVIEGHE